MTTQGITIIRMRLVAWVAAGMGALFLLQGCSTVPVTGRKQLNFVSADQEMQLGLSSFEQLKKETPVSKDPALNALVQRVGKQVAEVASKDLPNAQWEFVVFEGKEANAFCLPGGKVGVFTGILPITKNEAGLATVLSHEIAHATARHGSSRMSQAMLTQGIGQAAGAAVGSSQYAQYQNLFMGLYGVGTKIGVELPYSRQQESEADHIGLIYMARAGYDPKEAIAFWERFSAYNQQLGAANTPSFLRSHPVDAARIKQLQSLMPEAQAEFVKSRL
ncbi:MAG TPA: M48 family metallopeptidase [Clostridia bacterium]|nr:M48 family metallopeptidase [Clostridia bacterium]